MRIFKNLINMLSEIGGFISGLMSLGFIICKPFSELNLNNLIINESFNFDSGDGKEKRLKRNVTVSKKKKKTGVGDDLINDNSPVNNV